MAAYEIFKIQLPLMLSRGAKASALIYNKDRSITRQLSLTPKLEQWVRDDPRWAGAKTYVWAKFTDGNQLRIRRYAPTQEW